MLFKDYKHILDVLGFIFSSFLGRDLFRFLFRAEGAGKAQNLFSSTPPGQALNRKPTKIAGQAPVNRPSPTCVILWEQRW